MSNDGETPESSSAPEESSRAANRRTAVFIATFAVSVFLLLTGYRFLVGTALNDWYLYTVASNTASALNHFGESATLEGLPWLKQVPPQIARATMKGWERGEVTPTPEAIKAESDAPLTAWEQYIYRINKSRRESPGMDLGCRVMYVMRDSNSTKLANVEEQIKQGVARGDDRDPTKKAALDALRAKADELQKAVAETGGKDTAYVFPFQVVSECGAIEVMAIFFSAVIAFPTQWRKRAIGLAIGLPLMYGLNIVRLTVLGMICAWTHGGDLFNFAHKFVWQGVYIVFVVVVWMVWIEFVVRGRKA